MCSWSLSLSLRLHRKFMWKHRILVAPWIESDCIISTRCTTLRYRIAFQWRWHKEKICAGNIYIRIINDLMTIMIDTVSDLWTPRWINKLGVKLQTMFDNHNSNSASTELCFRPKFKQEKILWQLLMRGFCHRNEPLNAFHLLLLTCTSILWRTRAQFTHAIQILG